MSDQAATMLGPAAITYSRGSSPHDNMPRNCAAQDFRDFAAAVLADRQPGKGPGYFACAFDPPVRSATNAAPRRWLGLDLDGGLRNDEFAVLCGVLQRWSGFIYETASSKPDAPRARIVLELDQPAPRADLIRAATAMRARIDAEMIAQRVASPKWDTSCDRPEQPLFLPPVAAWSTHCEGDSICLAEVLADTASATAAKPLQLVAVGGGNLSMLPPAATGPAVIQVDRHQDVLALTGSLARLVHFGGADYESAMAFLRSERARGRWTRTVDDGELRRAFDGEIAACRNGLRDRTREAQHAPPTAVTTTPDGLPRYRGQTGAEILAEPLPEWRVDTLFPMKGVASIYGVSTAGKSFLAWDLGCAIAEGRSWFGYDTKRAPVSYLMLEGEAGKRVRTAAWAMHYGRDLPEAFRVFSQPFQITSEQDRADFASVVPKGSVVFVDTKNRASVGYDENHPKDMSIIIDGANDLSVKIDGLVVVVDHEGKTEGKGPRGHSSMFAALDCGLSVARKDRVRTWTIGKVKDGEDGVAHAFSLKVLQVGETPRGKPMTSCVVVAGEDRDVQQAADNAQNIMAAADDGHVLAAIIEAHSGGFSIPAATRGPDNCAAVLASMPKIPPGLRKRESLPRIKAAVVRLSLSGKIAKESYLSAGKRHSERWVPVPDVTAPAG